MITISNEKMRPLVSVKLNKLQLLVSSGVYKDVVKVQNLTPPAQNTPYFEYFGVFNENTGYFEQGV